MADRCKSCGAPIRWAMTTKDRRIPLDVTPTETGNMVIVDGVARVPTLDDEPALLLYVSHFATCPDAAKHRKGKG